MSDDDLIQLEASILAQSAAVTGLLFGLVSKKIFSPREIAEMYESALLNLEANQALIPDRDQKVFERARSLLEGSRNALTSLLSKSPDA